MPSQTFLNISCSTVETFPERKARSSCCGGPLGGGPGTPARALGPGAAPPPVRAALTMLRTRTQTVNPTPPGVAFLACLTAASCHAVRDPMERPAWQGTEGASSQQPPRNRGSRPTALGRRNPAPKHVREPEAAVRVQPPRDHS